MSRSTSLMLIIVGLCILLLGLYLPFYLTTSNVGKGDYNVEGGTTLELSWFLYKGERSEGGFTVSGGNEEVTFYIKTPSDTFIYAPRVVKTQFTNGFSAGQDGIYNLYFENQDLDDKIVHTNFVSPYEPRWPLVLVLFLVLPIILAGMLILIHGFNKLLTSDLSRSLNVRRNKPVSYAEKVLFLYIFRVLLPFFVYFQDLSEIIWIFKIILSIYRDEFKSQMLFSVYAVFVILSNGACMPTYIDLV